MSLSRLALHDGAIWLRGRPTPLSWLWLRDACPCPKCLHPSSRQKLHRSSDIPIDVRPTGNVSLDADAATIVWSPDHVSTYPLAYLHQLTAPPRPAVHRVPWTASSLLSLSHQLWTPYTTIFSDKQACYNFTNQLLKFGIAFLSHVPIEQTDNQSCELRRLAEHISQIRNTFYGPLWDVKSIANSKNVAYTNLNLDLHMDLLYFESPPRFQALHCLRNRVVGGKSIFVDALERSQKLLAESPDDFKTLSSTDVHFHYNNDGHHLEHSHPTIELHPGSTSLIEFINYSPPFQRPFPLDSPNSIWKALKRLSTLLEQPEARFEYLLREGDAVIFDNRRVLHARTAFTATAGSEETQRWLKGCYLETDPLLDRFRTMARTLE